MNNLYFACTSCKVFLDAGYRWAYQTLEDPGIVKLGHVVDPDLILAAEEYWNPKPDKVSKWLLEEVLPSVRAFLQQHRAHNILFGENDFLYDSGPDWFLEWIQEGYCAFPLPRTCLECLRLNSWAEVCDYMERQRIKPIWWDDADQRERAEKWFQSRLIRGFDR